MLSNDSIEILKSLRGCEISACSLYETEYGVVGIRFNKASNQWQVVEGGLVLDILDSDSKVSALWAEYCDQEGFHLETW